MSWRHHIEAVLCAVLLLATIIVVAVKTLAPGVAAPQSNPEMLLTNHLNITSKAKPPRGVPYPPIESSTTVDEGSLWDEGPSYTLSQ
jgi:hypothetical protein